LSFCLGVAILVHEFGHFILAKLFRIEVLRFSIGFGRFIFKWRRKGNGIGVAWFPLGGYVLMKAPWTRNCANTRNGKSLPPRRQTAARASGARSARDQGCQGHDRSGR
jgi:hypothetical protein